MHFRYSDVVVATLAAIAACAGGDRVLPAPTSSPPPPTASAPSRVESKPAAVAAPTVLSEEQKQRDIAVVARLGPYVDAYANTNGRLSKDRKSLLFSSNRDGLWQVYSGDPSRPAATPKQLTQGSNRAVAPSFTRDGKYVLFLQDDGANEAFHVVRTTAAGDDLTDLTPNPTTHLGVPELPRLRPDLMVYRGRDLKDTRTHFFVQDVGGTEAKEVYVDPQNAELLGVSPDGKHVLVERLGSASDQAVLRVDVDDGKATQLYPPPGKTVHITHAQYSADGKRVFIGTDEGGESFSVLMLDAGGGSGTIAARYREAVVPTASIEQILVSPKDDRIVVNVDCGNHSELRILDSKTLALRRTVSAALGVAELTDFTDDGKAFTAQMGNPHHPNDVFEIDAATGAIRALRTDVRVGFSEMPTFAASIDKASAFDGLTIPLNVYLPENRAQKRLPVIVSVHGGPNFSSKMAWGSHTRFLLAQGYAVVEPNIRGSTGFGRAYEMADNREKRVDAMKDMETVNKWVKGQRWTDPNRVVVMGSSYGGYIVLMALSRQPTLWRAGVSLVGPSNLVTLLQSTTKGIRSFFVGEFGDLDKDRALLEELSPMKRVDDIVAPLFVYQGQNDPRAPRTESDMMVASLRARNVPNEYMVAANEGHSIDHRENRLEFMSRLDRFLHDHLEADTAVDMR